MDFFNRLREDVWLPVLMPFWWRLILGATLATGLAMGAGIWFYTLALRGL